MVLDRDEEAAAKVAADVGGDHRVVDLADAARGRRARPRGRRPRQLRRLQHVAPIEDFDPERFALIHRVMLQAPFLAGPAVLPGHVRRAAGVGSSTSPASTATAPRPYKSAYVSAKHGLEGLSKVIALEGADKGVTSNTVCPGYVRTPLVEGQIADQARAHGIDEDEVVDDVLLARTALKRLVEPAEVAEMVGFLCGPAAASVTGSSFMLDGGWTAA